ncbi:hypothetical protein Tco_0185213 [Tanacetum coccineum]
MPEGPILGGRSSGPTSPPDYVPTRRKPEQAPPFRQIMFQSPDYVPESDPEADPEEDDDEDPEEDPIDYPADRGDDGDDEMDIEEDEDDDMDIDADEEDEDDEMDVEVDEEAEEEHSASAYPVVKLGITFHEPLPVPAWSDSEVAKLLAISSPLASPLSPWSSSPPQIPFLLSPPSPVLTAPPPSPIRSLGYRAATIRMRAEAAATSHSLPLLPPFILSPTRLDAPPPIPHQLLLHYHYFCYLLPVIERIDPSSAAAAARPAGGLRADYGFVATMDKEISVNHREDMLLWRSRFMDELLRTQQSSVSTEHRVGAHLRDFESMVSETQMRSNTMLDDDRAEAIIAVGSICYLETDVDMHIHIIQTLTVMRPYKMNDSLQGLVTTTAGALTALQDSDYITGARLLLYRT